MRRHNRFGHFEMSGSCAQDGSDCVLVRIYAPKQRRPRPGPRRRRREPQRPTTDKRRKLEKYGGKEPRFDPEGKDEVRSAGRRRRAAAGRR